MKALVWMALAALAPTLTAPRAPSIAGEWDAAYDTPGGVRSFKIVFEVEGEKLTGTVKRDAGDVPLTGTIKDNAVRFRYAILYNGNPLELTVTALLEGDSLKGMVDFGGAGEGEFSARRAKPSGTSPLTRAAPAR